jgi:DNA modification methylase
VLDPFMGTGTTNIACARWGRNSIGIEVDSKYFEMAQSRIADQTADLYTGSTITSQINGNVQSHARL